MKTIERTFDATTGETTDIEREMTKAEIDKATKDAAAALTRLEAEAQKETARQTVLTKLGLTAQEAAALLA